jgi:putative ABC transport system ATP-binding protein
LPEIQLQASHVYLSYRGQDGLRNAVIDVTLGLRGGQFTLMSGPSGSGKTSLLLLLACLLRPDSGEVLLNGEPMSQVPESARAFLRRRQIGFVSQSCRLLGGLTILQNVSIPLGIGAAAGASSREMAIEALARVKLEAKANLRPPDLSRDERHLVAIARALVRDPKILLADDAAGSSHLGGSATVAKLLAGLATGDRLVVLTSRDRWWANYAARSIRIEGGRIESDDVGS